MLCSPEEFAIYANGAKEIPLIGIITSSISVVIMAEMAEKCKAGDKRSALSLFKKSALISSYFLLPVMCFLMFYADDFIHIMFTDKYSGSIVPFRIYLLFLPIRLVNYGTAFIALGQSKKIMYRSIFSLIISSVLCYFFVYIWGMYGAAVAIIGTLYIWAIPYNWYTLSKEFHCSFSYILPLKDIGIIFLLSLSIAMVSSLFLLINTNSSIRFLAGSICFSIIYLAVFYKYIPDFRNMINTRLELWKLK